MRYRHISNQSDRLNQSGFTLIEVSLATAFVAIIIALLAFVTINITRSYNKGVWLAQINAAGQQLNADIGDKVRYSTKAVVLNSDRRLCVGGVSYLWNTEQNLDSGDVGRNRYSDSGEGFSLVRIDDPDVKYCTASGGSLPIPSRSDSKVRTLLGRGATIQEFNVVQGVNSTDDSGKSIPLLSLNTVISTEGANRPVRAYKAADGSVRIDSAGTNASSTWQCGDWYDTGDRPGVVDNNDRFVPANNQYCSFAEYNIVVYERSRR